MNINPVIDPISSTLTACSSESEHDPLVTAVVQPLGAFLHDGVSSSDVEIDNISTCAVGASSFHFISDPVGPSRVGASVGLGRLDDISGLPPPEYGSSLAVTAPLPLTPHVRPRSLKRHGALLSLPLECTFDVRSLCIFLF
jgi:hypothetical protein